MRSLGREDLPRVPRRRGAFLEAVAVPDRAFARIGSHLEILSELEAVGRARILAEAAEHATRGVIRKISEHLAARGVIAMPADHDQIFRAGQRAQVAGDAQRFARFRIHVQARRAAVALGDHRPL